MLGAVAHPVACLFVRGHRFRGRWAGGAMFLHLSPRVSVRFSARVPGTIACAGIIQKKGAEFTHPRMLPAERPRCRPVRGLMPPTATLSSEVRLACDARQNKRQSSCHAFGTSLRSLTVGRLGAFVLLWTAPPRQACPPPLFKKPANCADVSPCAVRASYSARTEQNYFCKLRLFSPIPRLCARCAVNRWILIGARGLASPARRGQVL